jgi:hypothetical protein
MKHFLSIADLSAEDVEDLFRLAAEWKRRTKAREVGTPLAGHSQALVFEKPSLRTRVTFEVGAHQLGARGIYLSGPEIGLGTRESVPDVARNLSRWVDGIVARVFAHTTVESLAQHATVPAVGNALFGGQMRLRLHVAPHLRFCDASRTKVRTLLYCWQPWISACAVTTGVSVTSWCWAYCGASHGLIARSPTSPTRVPSMRMRPAGTFPATRAIT